MIKLVVSGGQTGADQAGWRAAKRYGIPTGGWMPKGFLTEGGGRPDFAETFGAKEHSSSRYPPRTKENIRQADATLIFDTSSCKSIDDLSAGSRLATNMAMELEKTSLVIRVTLDEPPGPRRPEAVAGWFAERRIAVLNVAGNRESSAPGIGRWVEAYLCEVFCLLGYEKSSPIGAERP